MVLLIPWRSVMMETMTMAMAVTLRVRKSVGFVPLVMRLSVATKVSSLLGKLVQAMVDIQ
jgi:CelD/BcsL family acetyltransferase involved in cellulose biosynthesis